MTTPSVQDGIHQAGSPINLLWKPDSPAWFPEVVEREYAGWSEEQTAWHDSVAISDLSFHMSDTFIQGPDATRLLSEVTANNYENFAVNQAKQIVPVTERGLLVMDGILMRDAVDRYTLSGIAVAQNWVKYHADQGGYDVTYETNVESAYRGGADPALFRFQIQGPLALELVERAFGAPIPETKFFHATPVSLGGRTFRALRHGMAGQAGYEFIGEWADGAAVKEALMTAGEPLGLVSVGALAYPTSGPESGWIPAPTPAIYTDADLLDYRKHLGLFTFEGQAGIHGSYFSPDIEDYYISPWEIGYGRSISFNHDFIGRDELQAAKATVHRTKVTLVFNNEDVIRVTGDDTSFLYDMGRQRVESADGLIGMTYTAARLAPYNAVLSLAVIESEFATPGTEVSVVWGEHPGPGTDPDADLGFPRIRATVAPVPYNEVARTQYRQNA